MENILVSRVDQPKVPTVSGTGAFVAVFFLAWLALIFVLGARGVFVAPRGAPPLGTTDRPPGPSRPVSRWIPDHPATAGVYSFRRPSPDCGHTGVEMGRLWFSDLVHLRSLAWNLRLACGAGRYGDRRDRSTGAGHSSAPARFCGEQELCGLEPFRHFGPYGGREYRGAGPAARSQFLRSGFNVSYGTAAAGADSDIPGADIPDAALDGAVSGATARPIKNRLSWKGTDLAWAVTKGDLHAG